MKKLSILLVALFIGGCSHIGAISSAVKGIDNPVTVEDMYRVEQAAVVVVAAMNTYKTLCVNKSIPAKCRDVIVQLQSYTIPAAKQLKTLRAYFKNNDTLNAINAYNTVILLMADARAVAAANGVEIK